MNVISLALNLIFPRNQDKSRLWTEAESKKLLVDLVVYGIKEPPQGRHRDECECHLEDIYTFLFKNVDMADYIKDTPQWTQEETKELLSAPSQSGSQRHDSNACETYYYSMLSELFEKRGDSIEDGISQVVEEYYSKKKQA
ncbi:hypothetical protein P154DRAFT_539547 [Amniculicola lignicola CBS 123094]|uniref:Uncharacterized protein n=1 Tax=Amniculicola lignicola CBS 123094 TaxID=1392246 RepID=A0A6A5W0H1_9PLEO|nr:hypothetical protein P154DRAFT_539547 [Amniculicola lignicola CBS 123094]